MEPKVALQVATIAALTGLIGVLVGAIITAATNWILASKRERLEERRENRSKAIELKRAKREVGFELLTAETSARICVEKRHEYSADIHLTMDAWKQHESILSDELSDPEWFAVTLAFIAVDNLLTVSSSWATFDDFPESTSKAIAPILNDIERGRKALAV